MSDRFFLKNVLRDEIIYEGTCPGLEASPRCCSVKGERVSTWQRSVGLTDTKQLLPPGGGCLGVSCSSGGWGGGLLVNQECREGHHQRRGRAKDGN